MVVDIDSEIEELATKHPNVEVGTYVDEDILTLEWLYVAPKNENKGYASAFLNDLCLFADTHQLYIDLTPSSESDDLENDAYFNGLVKFYEKFGFQLSNSKYGYMTRVYHDIKPSMSPSI